MARSTINDFMNAINHLRLSWLRKQVRCWMPAVKAGVTPQLCKKRLHTNVSAPIRDSHLLNRQSLTKSLGSKRTRTVRFLQYSTGFQATPVNILVADDDRHGRFLLNSALSQIGHSVTGSREWPRCLGSM